MSQGTTIMAENFSEISPNQPFTKSPVRQQKTHRSDSPDHRLSVTTARTVRIPYPPMVMKTARVTTSVVLRDPPQNEKDHSAYHEENLW